MTGLMLSPTRRTLFRALAWTAASLVLYVLWPARFGGDTTVLVVQGNSMYPTLSNGDLVVARHQDHYHSGQVVVFDVTLPGSNVTMSVLHRISAVASDGTITTKGDNRATVDEFGTTTDDIVGEAVATIPHGGQVLWVLSRWWTLGAISGLIATLSLWTSDPKACSQARKSQPGPICLSTTPLTAPEVNSACTGRGLAWGLRDPGRFGGASKEAIHALEFKDQAVMVGVRGDRPGLVVQSCVTQPASSPALRDAICDVATDFGDTDAHEV